MSKLIHSAKECAYKIGIVCLHPPKWDSTTHTLSQCDPKGEENFPHICPLEEGLSKPNTIDELLQIAKQQGLLFDVTEKEGFNSGIFQNVTLMEKSDNNGKKDI
jgi:hypothetical protein